MKTVKPTIKPESQTEAIKAAWSFVEVAWRPMADKEVDAKDLLKKFIEGLK